MNPNKHFDPRNLKKHMDEAFKSLDLSSLLTSGRIQYLSML